MRPPQEGSTHRPDFVRRCWGRQLDLGRRVYNSRWGTGFNAGIGQFLETLENKIRILNLKTLTKNYTDCPFRKVSSSSLQLTAVRCGRQLRCDGLSP